jgi:serine/threonine protein kinase
VNKETLRSARKLQSLQRPGIKFTHGDIKDHNILVDEEGHITGLLDWESAGWYPEFGNTLQHCDFCQKTFGGMSF